MSQQYGINIFEDFRTLSVPVLGATTLPAGTGAVGGTLITPNGLICTSALGLGVLQQTGGRGAQLQFDATAEVAYANIYGPLLDVTKGFNVKCRTHLTNIGDNAALDVDFCMVDVVNATTIADLDDASVLNRVGFHMDGNSANILAQSLGGATLAKTDTTLDNVTTAGAYKTFSIHCTPAGVCTLRVDGVQVLTSSSFALDGTTAVRPFIGIEKVSDDTVCVVVIDYIEINGVSYAL